MPAVGRSHAENRRATELRPDRQPITVSFLACPGKAGMYNTAVKMMK